MPFVPPTFSPQSVDCRIVFRLQDENSEAEGEVMAM